MKKLCILFYSIILLVAHFTELSGQVNVFWTFPQPVASPFHGNVGPKIAVGGDGKPVIIWGKSGTHTIYFSKWNGAAFSDPIALNTGSYSPFIHSVEGPTLAAIGDSIYVCFETTSAPQDGMFIMRSTNAGSSFGSPVQLYDDPTRRTIQANVNIDKNGNPIVSFISSNASFTDARYEVVRSLDGGLSFESPVIANDTGGGSKVCECCKASIVTNEDDVYLLYRNNDNNQRDIWQSKSEDGGQSFIEGTDIDNTDWIINSCPTSGPDGAIWNNNMWACFMSEGEGSPQVYLSKIDLENSDVVGQISLEGAPNTFLQNHPHIATNGQVGAVTWQNQTSNGLDVFVSIFDEELSQNTSLTINLSNSIVAQDNPEIAIVNDVIYVVYEDAASSQLMYSTGLITGLGTGIQNLSLSQSIKSISVTDNLKLEDLNDVKTYKILNLSGAVIAQGNITHNMLNISTYQWANGMYLLELYNGQFTTVQRVIKH